MSCCALTGYWGAADALGRPAECEVCYRTQDSCPEVNDYCREAAQVQLKAAQFELEKIEEALAKRAKGEA